MSGVTFNSSAPYEARQLTVYRRLPPLTKISPWQNTQSDAHDTHRVSCRKIMNTSRCYGALDEIYLVSDSILLVYTSDERPDVTLQHFAQEIEKWKRGQGLVIFNLR